MKKPLQDASFWALFAAGIVTSVVVAAITWSLHHPYGTHWDEAEYLSYSGVDVQRLWAGKILTVGGRILIKTFGRPPAYRILALPFLAVVGFHTTTARLVSLACFVLSAWFVFLTGRRVGGRVAGAFAALIFTLSPEVVSASAFFGTDTSLYLATSALLYYVALSWEDNSDRPDRWIGLGVAVGLGFLAKTTFFLIACPLLAFWLIAGHYGWLGIPTLAKERKAGALAFLIAGPWWLLNAKKSFDYVHYARNFVRNSLGAPSPATWMRWLDTVAQCLLGHGVVIAIGLVVVACFVKVFVLKQKLLSRFQKAIAFACACTGMPIVLAQLSGTNHLLRHISPAVIPLALVVGLLAEQSGWAYSFPGAAAFALLFSAQLAMLVTPVIFPNKHPVNLKFPNGSPPWQALVRLDQWDWTPLERISQSCGLNSPRIAYLGNGRAFNVPQIEYSWVLKDLPQPDVTWLWRYEDGALDWPALVNEADQNDIVITAPGFVGEKVIKEDLDNEHNLEFADHLSDDPLFKSPVTLAMGRFEPVQVLVFVKKAFVCGSPRAQVAAQQ
ncbi:glycosyltransferase family 39 protein [Acidobacterium sp. S8]|uniref:ArnT family glycosyltransferase n=1 Tax=Acidobacterium sp. S8 TaxID=1641854 RepID=UPI00131C9ED5|nr:glycosyltransferase family 39 protein [Acidobacterium sp. S8]